MIGKILKQRYRIVEHIGSGGMADVYKAEDEKLGRIIAVKVLKKELSKDKEFLHRFYREACSVAKLSHNGIVQVFDFEEDEGLNFIVMEYVEAVDMKTWLSQKKVLILQELIPIARSILDALAFAHNKGIIHRDLKPQNILIGSDGTVKVADFGLARAKFSETITQTGAFMGSVHYFSPEQAQGKPTSAPADLYSLGIILFECLTGRLPFEGENPVSVALKQVQQPPPVPSEVNPQIPKIMEDIILKALQKNPLMRYQTAEEMAEDLAKLTGEEMKPSLTPSPESKHAQQPTLLRPPSKAREGIEEVSYHLNQKRENLDGVPEEREFPYLKTIAIIVGIMIAITAIILIWLYSSSQITEIITPEIKGMLYTDAQSKASKEGLSLKIQKEIFSSSPEGTVLEQNPKAGTSIKTGRIIYITLSKGTTRVEMPDLRGVKLSVCRELLTNKGLQNIRVTEENSDELPSGMVISHKPGPQYMVTPSTLITLTVSKGGTIRKMPDLTGKTEDEAKKILEGFNVKLSVASRESSSQVPLNCIINQSIAPGAEIQSGASVKVVLSRGIEGLIAPNLVGKTVADARKIASSMNMELVFEGDDIEDRMIVSQQVPNAGEVLKARIINVWADVYTVVPSLIGKKLPEAQEAVVAASLQLGDILYDSTANALADTVLEQDPAAGLEVVTGTKIKLIVSGQGNANVTQAITEGTVGDDSGKGK